MSIFQAQSEFSANVQRECQRSYPLCKVGLIYTRRNTSKRRRRRSASTLNKSLSFNIILLFVFSGFLRFCSFLSIFFWVINVISSLMYLKNVVGRIKNITVCLLRIVRLMFVEVCTAAILFSNVILPYRKE